MILTTISRILPFIAMAFCCRAAEPPIAKEPPAADGSVLSLDRIFASNELNARTVGPLHWSRRSAAYFTLSESKGKTPGSDLVRIELATGAQEIIAPAEALVPKGRDRPLAVEAFWFTDDESKVLLFTDSRRVWRRNTRGDSWVLDLATRDLRQLGADAAPSTLMFTKFSPDGTRVAYVRENNIYVQDLRGMAVTALTDTGSADIVNGTGDWVNEEELDIRDGFRWSPDGESIAFWQFDTSGVGEFHLIDNTQGRYPRITSFPYPKVGERNSATRVGVVGAGGGPVRWLDLPGDPREHYVPRMEWTPDGSRLVVQQLNRLQNTNRVMVADPTTGSVHTAFTESDPAWLENENPVRWLNQGRELLWLSERDGWRHAYVASLAGQEPSVVTNGSYDVIGVEAVDEAGGWLYFAASPENATQRYLYRAPLRGGDAERLSPAGQPGWHTYDISPDATWAVHTYSTWVMPPVVELVRLPGHEVVRVLADNEQLREKLPEVSAEFLKVDIGEDRVLDAWCLTPPGMDPAGKYPVLFHVYGEPHGQTVRDAWQGSLGLWHRMLARQGYIVASVDNRGTMAPRGRAWRKVVHRQIGILAPQEQAAAALALLKRWPYADPTRVGIWGWSGGGSMSLNAIFRYPELYRTAIAVAPNADQLLYDTIYQERYMGLPAENAAGYRDGSPLTFAHRLEGNLLVVHGTGDDNGHYQGTEMLMNELIAHGKHFTVMPYPARSHSINEGRNTTRHFYGLLTRYLHDNLPRNPGAAAVPGASAAQTGAGAETRTISGWTVHVSRELLAHDAAATERAIGLLSAQLEEIVRCVPPSARRALQEVPLWFSPEYPGTIPKAEYHPSADWLRENGRDPRMARSVEFTNVRIFEAETRRMPNFVLHELAHAYHDRELADGFANPQVRAAYERAVAGGRYDRVEQRFGDGRTAVGRAYAMTNPQEYFAETSEAFFSTNDFFPFTRDDLVHHDPEMVNLLIELWGVGDGRAPADARGSTTPTP
ncbi:MAG: zinc-dependent peptidase [Phycisphaerales bacterium]|nr:zinc-dependent peptidase [Phycisphaerales bacterium]